MNTVGQRFVEESLAKISIACMTTALQEVNENHVIRTLAGGLHVLYKLQSTAQVVLRHQRFD